MSTNADQPNGFNMCIEDPVGSPSDRIEVIDLPKGTQKAIADRVKQLLEGYAHDRMGLLQAKAFRQNHEAFTGKHLRFIIQAHPNKVAL